jgi:hypothetical protein
MSEVLTFLSLDTEVRSETYEPIRNSGEYLREIRPFSFTGMLVFFYPLVLTSNAVHRYRIGHI